MNRTPTTPGLVLSDLTLSAIQAEATRAHLRHGPNSILNLADDRDRYDDLDPGGEAGGGIVAGAGHAGVGEWFGSAS